MGISVSVIIPVYNVDIYLSACLDSVLSQTRTDIELICVNDCSPDASRAILADYAARDTRITILDHAQNRGLSAARNTGLDYASGEYVFFLDSDDVLTSSECLFHLYEIAGRDRADEVIGATLRWDEQTGEKHYGHHEEYLKENLSAVRFQDCPALRHNVIACNKLLKRQFLEGQGLRFNSDLRKFEDNVFSWKAHLLARSISLTLQPTYLHRLRQEEHAKSIMQDKENDVGYHILAAGYVLDFLTDNPQFQELRHYFDRYLLTWCCLDVREATTQNPSGRQKRVLLEQYLPVLARIPAASLAENLMPGRYRLGLQLMQQEQFEEAWQVLTVKDFKAYCQQKRDDSSGSLSSLKGFAPLRKLNALVKSITSR